MAPTTQPGRALDGALLWQRFGTWRADLTKRAARLRAYHTTRRDLDALSDRDLADMGIGRSQISTIARQAVRKA